MFIRIEDKNFSFTSTVDISSTEFDIIDNRFVGTMHMVVKYNTEIYNYRDFSLFWCIVPQKPLHSIRFVLFNMQKQVAYCLLEHNICKSVVIRRLNNQVFLVLCTGKTSFLYICKLEQNKVLRKCIILHEIKQIMFVEQQFVVVHSINGQRHTLGIADIFNLNFTPLINITTEQSLTLKYIQHKIVMYNNLGQLIFKKSLK